MLLGVLVVLAPVSGLPLSLRAVIEFALGAAVFFVGFSLRLTSMRKRHSVADEPAAPLESVAPEPVAQEVVDESVAVEPETLGNPPTGSF